VTTLVAREKAAHWYTRDGEPMHTLIGANGKERATTLRDARKFGYLPSVTTVLDVVAKPGLNAWINDQAILAALTLPRIPGETDSAFAHRVVADMDAQRDQAAATGIRIHDAICMFLLGGLPDPEMLPYIQSVNRWFEEVKLAKIAVETTVVSREWGFAGRMDLYAYVNGHRGLIDFKSQDVKKGKANFYETWPMQLSAYGQAQKEGGKPVDDFYSVVIPTEKGESVQVHKWDERESDFKAFAAAFLLWKYVKNYEPLAQLKEAA